MIIRCLLPKWDHRFLRSVLQFSIPLVFSLLLARAQAGVSRFSLPVATGATTSANEAIGAIGPDVSVNDSGTIALIANLTSGGVTGSALLTVGDGIAATRVSFPPTTTRVYSYPKINNAGSIVEAERVTGSPPAFLIRLWPANQVVADTVTITDPFQTVLLPSLGNDRSVVFVGISSNVLSLYVNETGQKGNSQPVVMLTGGGFRPFSANQGNCVVSTNSVTNNMMERISPGSTGFTRRNLSTGFTVVGNSPGISDDGRFGAFYGKQSSVKIGVSGIYLVDATNPG
jgi:hypothetical protein